MHLEIRVFAFIMNPTLRCFFVFRKKNQINFFNFFTGRNNEPATYFVFINKFVNKKTTFTKKLWIFSGFAYLQCLLDRFLSLPFCRFHQHFDCHFSLIDREVGPAAFAS